MPGRAGARNPWSSFAQAARKVCAMKLPGCNHEAAVIRRQFPANYTHSKCPLQYYFELKEGRESGVAPSGVRTRSGGPAIFQRAFCRWTALTATPTARRASGWNLPTIPCMLSRPL